MKIWIYKLMKDNGLTSK